FLRPSGPVALQRQHAVRLSKRRAIAGRGGGFDRASRALGRAALIAKAAVHVREPERVPPEKLLVGKPREASLMRMQDLDAFRESSEEVERMGMRQRHVHHPPIAIWTLRQPLQPPSGEIEMR